MRRQRRQKKLANYWPQAKDTGCHHGNFCTRKFSNSKSKSSRGKSHMDVKILERLNRSWIDKPTWQMPQPPTCQAINPAGPPGLGGVFFGNARDAFRGLPMLTAETCRDRAAECQKMAERAPSARMRDILLDMGRTWTRLALEAEQWTQLNQPLARLTKSHSEHAPREVARPTPLLPRGGSRREPL